MPKGIMLTSEQQAARREEIIGVALRLIAENGFQKTSMREIAVLANMGKSSLYDFLKRKTRLLYTLMIRTEILKIDLKGITMAQTKKNIIFVLYTYTPIHALCGILIFVAAKMGVPMWLHFMFNFIGPMLTGSMLDFMKWYALFYMVAAIGYSIWFFKINRHWLHYKIHYENIFKHTNRCEYLCRRVVGYEVK